MITRLHCCVSMVYFVLSSIFGGKKEPAKSITPYLKRSLLEREESDERPVSRPHSFPSLLYHALQFQFTDQPDLQNNVAELLVRNSPPNESLSSLTMRVINLNFASIHTTFVHPLSIPLGPLQQPLTHPFIQLHISHASPIRTRLSPVLRHRQHPRGSDSCARRRGWMDQGRPSPFPQN